MVHIRKKIVMAVLSLFMIMGVIGCPKKSTETASQSVPSVQETPAPSPPAVETVPPSEQRPVTEEVVKPSEPVKPEEGLKDVFFDFDKSTINPEMKSVLDHDANWLKTKAQVKVQIEGHADERGTNEYNLALGEKRAHSVKQFLASEGVKASRLSTISYGEDRPYCTEHNESCYKLNRRAHFVLLK